MRRARVLVALLAAGCGAQGGWGDDSVDVDAGTSGDGGVCSIGVTFEPPNPTAGETVYAYAAVPDSFGQFLAYSWTVQFEGSDLPTVTTALDGSAIRFVPDAPGPHYVQLTVDGSSCFAFDAPLNIRAPGATDTTWRLRFVAPPGALAPTQERAVVVPSGADFETGEISLDTGAVISGSITDDDGVATAAYLRLTPAGTPDVQIDGFAGASGAFELRTTLERHDLLIIPFRADLPPYQVLDWTPQSMDFALTGGDPVTGTVRGPSGTPLAGALVTLRVAGVPSTVGTSDAGGAFALRARAAGTAVVTVDVVPPAGSGLPRLLSSGAVLDLTQPFDIRYAAGLASRDVGGVAIEQGGSTAGGAEVTFTGAIASAGGVTVGTTVAPAAGRFAIPVTASGAGVLPSALVPAAPGSAIVTPASGPPGVVAVDLSAAAPAAIDAPAGATLTGRVIAPGGTGVAGADLRAVPIGALGAAALGQVHVVADELGQFSLPVAGGGQYELVIADPSRELALLRTDLVVAGPASLGDLELPDGLRVRGTLRLSGSSLGGAAVTVFCESCSGADRDRPAAESGTDGGGAFRATVVDPGLPE